MKDIELQTEAFKRYIQECDELSITPDYASAFNAAWNARAAVEADRAQRVPDGWKLVPVEPTVEMLDAFRAVDESAMGPCFFDAYRAMLAATPAPAQQEPSEVKGGQLVADPLSRLGENSPGVEAMIIAAVDRVRATEIVSGESPESFRDAIALRVADLAKPTFLATSSAQHQEPPHQERKPMTDEINQCDGCRRGLPLKGGMHTGPGMWDKMVCQKHRYGIKE